MKPAVEPDSVEGPGSISAASDLQIGLRVIVCPPEVGAPDPFPAKVAPVVVRPTFLWS